MNNRDFSNIGEEIRRTVEDAMNSMDYGQLNQKINQTVNMAMDEARRQFGRYHSNYEPHVEPPHVEAPHVEPPPTTQPRRETGHEKQMHAKTAKVRVPVKTEGKIAGPLLTIFGGLGTAAGMMITIASAVMLFSSWGNGRIAALLTLIFFGMATAGTLVLFGIGMKKWGRYRTFRQYFQILDGREFCSVEEISKKTGESGSKVRKRLKKLIKRGMFPEGFLDEQGTCFIVTKDAYQLYCQAQEARRQREEEEREQKQRAEVPKTAVEEMIAKGDYYIRTIREANDAIPGAVISAKLDRLEMIVRKIFESVKKHPEQMDEMDRFMEYYLPTTEKLVNAYREFDALPVKGENVTASMQEIENTLDTITHAFEQLLDDLFMDAAFDISSDISVLQTMLAREGYKEKDFK